MKKFILIISILLISSCSHKAIEVKSPCVSAQDGPCGPKTPINSWWINNSKA